VARENHRTAQVHTSVSGGNTPQTGGGRRAQWHPIVSDERERLRHDSDHRVRLAVHPYIASYDLRISAERALPQRVAQDDFALAADFPFIVLEDAAELRRHAGTEFDPELVETFCEH